MEWDWDEHNEGHVARHGVDTDEVEQALGDPAHLGVPAYRVAKEERWALLGKTEAGRILFVVFTMRGATIRVVTAREATGKEATLSAREGETAVKEVNRREEIPVFQSEAEEAEFWATHSLGEDLLQEMSPLPVDVPLPVTSRTRPLAVRFDEDVIQRLKHLAQRKGTGYQTLLKQFVVERLYEEEKRERLVG